ncbi:MAG: hypothetical protein II007_00360 [Gammaproteobacteria bacterium]|nr:hypothetical protein [Gammaproteobacteria bacterium]
MKKILNLVFSFLKDGAAFFLLGFILMLPLELFGGIYAKEAEAIFFESLAPRTIMALFVLSTLVASASVLIFGTHNPENKKNDCVYKYVVFKITSFSMSFSSAGTGMLLGLSGAAAINQDFGVALMVLISAIVFLLYWCYFEGLNQVCLNGFGESVPAKLARVLLISAIVAAPAIYAFSYEPVKECTSSEPRGHPPPAGQYLTSD